MNDLMDAAKKVLDWWEFSGSEIEGKELMESLSKVVDKVESDASRPIKSR